MTNIALSIGKAEKKAKFESKDGPRSNETLVDVLGSDVKLGLTEQNFCQRDEHLTSTGSGKANAREPKRSDSIHEDYEIKNGRSIVELNEEKICRVDENTVAHSIFDLKSEAASQKGVTLPQILTVFATAADHNSVEKEAKTCLLPTIQDGSNVLKRQNSVRKKSSELFDFRAAGVQKKARSRQIKQLKKHGYGTGCDSDATSRFVSHPYEGACDDITVVPKISNSSPKGKKKSSNADNNTAEEKKVNETKTSSPPADEETIAKIETAFSEWKARKQREVEEPFRLRKRSSSHSPPRTCVPFERTKKQPSSHSGSVDFLNHRGNLRQRSSARLGTGNSQRPLYQAVASPSTFRRRLRNSNPKVGTSPPISVVTTTVTALLEPPRSPASSLRFTRKPLSPLVLKNKRLAEIQSQERPQFSSSLPDLSKKDTAIMNHSGHRPRSSSLRKSAASKGTKSPKPQRKSNLKPSKESKQNEHLEKQGSDAKKKASSPALPRRVTLNTSLPTASPTFQRAMKGMNLPEKDYSEIFVQNRRDSILQSYSIPESALNSFRDDYELQQIESSSNALDEIAIRFKEDVKIYKEGWDPKSAKKEHKSILKKRRQSVDDLEISTRKNLAKYLESKLEMDGAGLLASK